MTLVVNCSHNGKSDRFSGTCSFPGSDGQTQDPVDEIAGFDPCDAHVIQMPVPADKTIVSIRIRMTRALDSNSNSLQAGIANTAKLLNG